MRIFTCLFLIISSLVFLAHYFLIGQAVYGDGRFYYSYARSLSLQGDLDTKDELTHPFSPQGNNLSGTKPLEFSGYPVQSLGPALIWVPVIALQHQIALRTGLLANGFSDIYQIAVGLASIFFTGLALSRLGKLMTKMYGQKIAIFALFLTWAGSNLFFYTAIDNINTHFLSFSLASFALSEYLDGKKPSLFLTGIMAGLAFQNRQMDIIFHASLFLAYFWQDKRIASLLKFTVPFILTILPQLMVWRFQFGSFLPPMTGAGFWNFDPASIFKILFSPPQGLLFTAPAMFLALLFLFSFKTDRYIRSAGLSLIAFLTINTFWWSPTGGASFGQRFLIVYYPLLSLVLASLLKKVPSTKTFIFTAIITLLNLAHTFIFLYWNP